MALPKEPVDVPKETHVQPDEVKQYAIRYPPKVRKKPAYLDDYVTEENDDELHMNMDYCYRLASNVPLTFREAVTSPDSTEWSSAMDDEMANADGLTNSRHLVSKNCTTLTMQR